jgi:hypothetical protein
MAALLVGGGGAAICWMPLDDPGAVLWSLRAGFTTLAVVGFVGFFFSLPPKDEVTDHLRLLSKGKHFDQEGFAFLPTVSARNGIAYLELLFQNQRDCNMIGHVVLQPQSDLFRESGFKAVGFEIPCEAGVFGIARLPIAVPLDKQGCMHYWDVGAGVNFPDGNGGLLRFGRGLMVGRVDAVSPEAQGTQALITIASLLVLSPSISVPARTNLAMPLDVLADVPDGLKPEIEVLKDLSTATAV